MAHELISLSAEATVWVDVLQTGWRKSVLWFFIALAWARQQPAVPRSSDEDARRGSSKLLPNSLTL